MAGMTVADYMKTAVLKKAKEDVKQFSAVVDSLDVD